MKILVFIFFSLGISTLAFGQEIYSSHPEVLDCPNDSFYLDWDNGKTAYKIKSDTANFNLGATKGAYTTLYYGNKSIVIKYQNKIPYGQYMYFTLQSPLNKQVIRVGFDAQPSIFNKQYLSENSSKVKFNIPETYELANVIWMLSPCGQRANDLNKNGNYYLKVQQFFHSHLNHPIFKKLDFPDSLYFNKYYDFRENSFAFNFKNPKPGSTDCKLLYNGPYYYVYGSEFADSSLFGKLLPLIEDFARKSNFRKFYNHNLVYYKKEIERQEKFMPVKGMWYWLEDEFQKPKYNSYKVVFSPLIKGSHSTQRYSSFLEYPKIYNEMIMFVCGPNRYDNDSSLTDKQKEGLLSGVVFTEIDHNYVNPATNKYAKEIEEIFKNRTKWVDENLGNRNYRRGIDVFNEYMTHAVFCLYAIDKYEIDLANFIIKHRESMMVEKRGFSKFIGFSEQLLRLHKQAPKIKSIDLYPSIVEWCKQQN